MHLAVGEPPPKGAERPVRRFVAIKKLRDVVDRDRVVGLLRQRAALIEQVRDPRFVEVLEILPDEPAIVSEYVHGVTLARALDELRKAREQVFTEAAVEIGVELAEALYRANSTPGRNGEPLGLVHLRLSPSNVMLGADGGVRILDFVLGGVLPPVGRQSPEDLLYLAPEQLRREEVDHRTDLFGIGLILYELLMNQPAWRAGESVADADLQRRIGSGDLREACRNLEQTLPALGPILRRELQVRPDDRYRTGADLTADLRRQLYRERGSYLKEFCEFFFDAIYRLEAAPSIDDHGGGRGRRRSIEERLRESLSKEGPATPARPSPVSAGRTPSLTPESSPESASPQRTASSPPRPPPPRLASPRAEAPVVPQEPQGEPMSTGGKKTPPRPPVGGPASRAQPFSPPPESPARKGGGPMKVVGERRPDETGMLEMVPLSSDKDKSAASEDPSATAFFAIPAPKADRSRATPAAPPPPAAGPVGVAPPSAYPPGPPGMRPPIAGPVAQQPVQPMVQGPVVSYGNAPGASPFQVAGPSPMATPSAEAGQRVQSNRVYAILVGVFLLVAVAVVVAVWLIPREKKPEPTPTPVVTTTPTVVVEKSAKPQEDTAPPPAPVPTAKPKPKSTTPKATPAPSSGPGTLTVILADASQATAVEVVCPSGFRQRSALSGGKGSIASVPQEKCTMYFKGGAPAQFAPVSGGRSFNCSIIGTTAVCK